jgi:RNA polymerase sigma-70 factor (ECF subfamily)
MAAIASGDREAQRVLLERLTARIRRIARLLLQDAADAEDAAQVALLKILASVKTLHDTDTLEHWADRIAVRVALQHAKRERRRKGILRRWLIPERLPWGQDARSYPVEGNIEDMLRRLSGPQREAFVLRHMLEYTVTEIAELTGTPRGTVKNRLISARKLLRQVLELQTRQDGGGRP